MTTSTRGRLRVYLGAAPGVGKTYAMLEELQRRRSRGADAVVGLVETHGRPHTAAKLAGLEVLPRARVTYRGVELDEFDLEAALSRRPEVIGLDELAHTNVPGSRHAKRWQDVEALLDAGIDVISTVNIQHLESMNDVVAQITGVEQKELIPDEVVRTAEQIHFVDQTPEALRRRLAHGNVYGPGQVDAALDNYFRVGNLGALRELALLWVADRVDDELRAYRRRHGIDDTWDTRERVVVAVTGAPGNAAVIRRAARMAERSRAELVGIHVRDVDGRRERGTESDSLAASREILASVGGTYREVGAADVAEALVRTARAHDATQIVLGASARSRWQQFVRGSVINDVVRAAGDIDVHVITSREADTTSAPQPAPARPASRAFAPRRLMWGWVLAVVVPVALCIGLAALRDQATLSTQLLAFTLAVAAVAVVGGFGPALVAAVVSFGLANWYFTPPLYTWTIGEPENLVALVVFVANAAIIGRLVSTAVRRAAEATRVRADAETLAALAGSGSGGEDGLDGALELLRTVTSGDAAAVLVADDSGWATMASAPPGVAAEAAEWSLDLPLGDTARLVTVGSVDVLDQRVLDAFCAQLAEAIEHRRLRQRAETADRLADANDLRSGLLAALSHDLRTPIGAVQAAASTLRQPDVGADPTLRAEFVSTIIDYSSRLHAMVTNLLELSRIHADGVALSLRQTSVEEVLPGAVASIDLRGVSLDVRLPSDLPDIVVDAGLFERVLANLLDNAAKWSPSNGSVRVDAAPAGTLVAIRVVDSGPGIPPDRRQQVLEPFQRVGDTDRVAGTGLGLAVVVGLLSMMGGSFELDDTPGGGTTATVRVPAVQRDPGPSGDR